MEEFGFLKYEVTKYSRIYLMTSFLIYTLRFIFTRVSVNKNAGLDW
jgi:hypothetical protein